MTLVKRLLGNTREVIFGLEDGLVSTLGVVTGVATGTGSRSIVILTGLVVVLVESLSMAAGTYLSNKSERQLQLNTWRRRHTPLAQDHLREVRRSRPLRDGVFMYVSYFAGGAVPVLPYLFLTPQSGVAISVILTSVILTVVTLFMIGAAKGKLVGVSPARSGLEMTLVSAAAAGLGYGVGHLARTLLAIPTI